MSIEPFVRYSRNVEGKITIATVLLCVLVISVFFFADAKYKDGIQAQSDVATTSVFVVNSPPEWVVDPAETPASSVSSPTNEGDVVTWTATAFDPNGSNSYWLLICRNTTATETDMIIYNPIEGVHEPDCMGGEDYRWARSALTADGQVATATYLTSEGREEEVENVWYAFICDDDEHHPRCNVTDIKQGDGDSGSPFYVNHRPVFTEFNAPSATDPGDMAEWTSVASNTNTELSDQTVKLFVCRTDQFDEENQECDGGDGNTFASSTYAINPTVNYTTRHPKPHGFYNAYGFVVDAYGLTAPLPTDANYDDQEERMQGENAQLEINNVDPEVEVDTFEFFDPNSPTPELPDDTLTPYIAEGESHGFKVVFKTSDANSCVTQAWSGGTTTGYMEMVDVAVNIYRDGVTCNDAGDYDPNNCYPHDVASSTYGTGTEGGWGISCVLDNSECTGDSDSEVKWECTFPLWFLVDPTDGNATNSVYWDEEWVASVVVTDVGPLSSERTQSEDGVDMGGFLAFRLDSGQEGIEFGDLEVEDRNEILDRATTIFATGNVGVDQELEGTPMCPDFDPVGETPPYYGCFEYLDPEEDKPDNTIPARFQRFAKGLITDYESGNQLADVVSGGEPAFLALNVLKTTSIALIQNEDIGWGIEIHDEITRAGVYRGQNTFIAISSDASNWE